VSGKAGKGKEEDVRSGPRSSKEEKDKGRPAQEHREDSDNSDEPIDTIDRKMEERREANGGREGTGRGGRGRGGEHLV
jgi:hypothetical protein